nr:hypothetical protein [Tanacetum cinerariifolium]
AVRDFAEEAEAQVPAQGDDVQEPATEEVVNEVVPPTPTPPSPPSPVILSSPPHKPPCPPQPQDAEVPSLLFQKQLEIVKLKARVKKLEKINKVKSSKLKRLKKVGTSQRIESSDDMENVFNQGRMVADMDMNEGIELVKDAEVVAASTPIPAAKPKILNIVAAPTVSTRRRKGFIIRDPEEELSSDTPSKTPKVKDKGKGILIEAPKPMKKKSREKMEEEDAKIIKSINETPAQKAAKKRKLHEQAKEDEDLKKQLEVVDDKDDDVFIES